MTSLALLFIVAALGMAVAKWLRAPPAPFVLGAGLLLRAAGAPLEGSLIDGGLVLSATFLVFVLGAQMDPSHIGREGRVAFRIGLAHLGSILVVGVPVGLGLGADLRGSVYFVLALGAGSTLLVFDLLRARERFYEPLGRAVLGVLLIQNALVLTVVSLLDTFDDGPLAGARALAAVLLLVLAARLVTRFLGPIVLEHLKLDDEERLLFVLAVLFVFAGAAHALSLPPVVGAFFGGAGLARFPLGAFVRGHLISFEDFFVATFYVTLGASVPLPTLGELLAESALVLALLATSPFLLLRVARRAGLTVRASLEAVSLIVPCGELSILIAMIGLSAGHLDESAFRVMITVAAVTMVLAPALSSDALLDRLARWYPGGRSKKRTLPLEGHVLLVGCGDSGRVVLDALLERGQVVVVLDDDPGVVDTLSDEGVLAFRGDGGDPAQLANLGLERARAVVSFMRRIGDNERLLEIARHPPVFVRVFSELEARRVERAGGRAVVESELGKNAFMSWFETLAAA
jgi:Kef-type K+ transport system membrane component KefB